MDISAAYPIEGRRARGQKGKRKVLRHARKED
jgi:hypothetical protein